MLLTFYGSGKGKTTAALGILFRFLGYSDRVLVAQFMKDCKSGEYNFYRDLIKLNKKVRWYCLGTSEFVDPNDLGSDNASIVMAVGTGFLLYEFPRVFNEFKPNLVVFDELGLATHLSLVPLDVALNALSPFAGSSEYHAVVTGRYVPKEIRDVSDLVTRCDEVKHYFRRGYVNIRGLDI